MGLVDSDLVKQLAIEAGFSTVGITPAVPIGDALDAYYEWLEEGFAGEMGYLHDHFPLKVKPQSILPSAKSVVVVTANYNQVPSSSPKIARYALGKDYHRVLRSMLSGLAKRFQEVDPESEWRACVDSAPIMERAYAQMAGLGWFGKNTMLIDSRRGSWFFLGILLTSLELAPDKPSTGGCGSCTKCIDACPTGAIVQINGRWQVDSRRCISYQTIEKKGELEVDTAGWLFGCDICQEVCPFNEPRESQPLRATITSIERFLDRTPVPPAESVAEMSYEEWDAMTQGSAMRRTGYDGLRRNARAVNDCE